jgi:hypothetical protein
VSCSLKAFTSHLLLLVLILITPAKAAEFSAKVDSSIRFDDRSGRDERYQYRIRFYPTIALDEKKVWSINAFATTGDVFSSSHNTFDDGGSDLFYIRRAYLRYETNQGKTEMGILPTYKGRVSSTGLSKDGWIKGLRHVSNLKRGKFEVVFGELEDTRASRALNLAKNLNYLEVEYSGELSEQSSFEVSLERLLDSNFVTGELRFQSANNITYAAEIIDKVDTNDLKFVASVETELSVYSQQWEVFAYYSYVSDKFGARAELTEDFLATGHGLAIEVASSLNQMPLDWFAKFEAYESNTRIQFGLKYSLSL